MGVEQSIASVEGASTVAELLVVMQRTAEDFGFSSYNFIDAGEPHIDEPFWSGTTGAKWESEYLSNNFVHEDPTLSLARKSNKSFFWSDIDLSVRTGPKSGSRLTMEAAKDHGFYDGLVIPLHVVDKLGRPRSACVGFFWTEANKPLSEMPLIRIADLHIFSIYWIQKAMDLIAVEFRKAHPVISEDTDPNHITPKERDVLSWAARGKTTSETADIMTISDATVKWHFKNILAKLDAQTKTQAVTKAIYLGLIDI